ncbi:hypothetical protein DS843_08010 [Roseomonas genomospecies 6]|uniref:Uncharacterized protein n=1 Tax=Roseomonas genomospecies 6 TaxID=214106 RepID=A0A9W7NLY6_9PROT|nr:hypothetical protein DS843_08010 [Roseomonas genomospecies 6]
MDIRAVSGLLANRPTTAQSVADGVAQTPEASVSKSRPQTTPAASPSDPVVVAGGYISPVLRYDQDARLAVILYRDRSSGETRNQIPSERVVEEYRRTASRLGVPTDRAAEDGTATASGGATKGSASSAGSTTPGGAGRNGPSGFGATVASDASPTGTPLVSPAATGSPATGIALPGTPPGAGSSGAGSYGTGSPGALVSVTV